MLLAIWWSSLAANAGLLATPALWRSPLRWFRVWLIADFGVTLIEYLIRNNGPLYSAIWQTTFPILLAFLITACLEMIWGVRGIQWSLVIVLAVGIHVLLSLPHQWRGSSLETIESLGAAWSLICGLALVPAWRRCRFQNVAMVMMLYCLGKASCYYAAPAFPQTIGLAIVGVSLVAMIWWLIIFSLSKDQ